jgi:acetoin utilization protein AcuB
MLCTRVALRRFLRTAYGSTGKLERVARLPDNGRGTKVRACSLSARGPRLALDSQRDAYRARIAADINLRRPPIESFMSKPIPSIQKYMTTTPSSIEHDQTIAQASALMREQRIRHLPVLRGGKLVGVLTDRDIKLIEALSHVSPKETTVQAAMTEAPYTVHPDTPLDEVTSSMAQGKYGSAIVVQNDKVVGIFTTVDACEALSDLLTSRLRA